jgi:hypothetical protein
MSDEIPHKTSLLFYRFIVKIKLDLAEFAFRIPNCVLATNSDWRCTYYGKDYTVNIFNAGKLPYPAIVCMTFFKEKSIDSFDDEYERLFGQRPESSMTTRINWVEKFYTPYTNIDLEKLYDTLTNSNECVFVERVYKKDKLKGSTDRPVKIQCYSVNEGSDTDDTSNKIKSRVITSTADDSSAIVSIDQKKFCALIIHPFPTESNFAIEAFSSGVLNVPGIPSVDYFEKIKKYINTTLAPVLKSAQIESSPVGATLGEFIF